MAKVDKVEKDNMLEPLGNYALSKFNIIEGMNVLDIGCGTGITTTQIAKKINNTCIFQVIAFLCP